MLFLFFTDAAANADAYLPAARMLIAAQLIAASFAVHASPVRQEQYAVRAPSSADDYHQSLLDGVWSAQAKKNTEYFPTYIYPPLIWQRQRGIFDSFVHMNFHGSYPVQPLLRNLYKFPDDNAFVTMFILEALIVSNYLRPALVQLDDGKMSAAIEAILTHRDKNSRSEPLFSFWNQQRLGGAGERATPQNIVIPLDHLRALLSKLGPYIGRAPWKQLRSIFNIVVGVESTTYTSFRIPSDSDDTACALALSVLLQQHSRLFPDSARLLQPLLSHGALYRIFSRYAYRPFSQSLDDNRIDPRTYSWIRKFLELRHNQRPGLAIVSTWMQHISEIRHQFAYRKMPFNVNNVDLSVVCNAVYAMTKVFELYGTPAAGSPMHQLYSDNIGLLGWALENRVVERYQSHALLYYPSKFAFYWFASRIASVMLNNAPKFAEYSALVEAVRNYGVKQLLSSVQCSVSECYWDEFLGSSDGLFGHTLNGREDRVFSTATALNCLIDSYALASHGSHRLALADAPPSAVGVMQKARFFLESHARLYPKENAFFSASAKGQGTSPMYMPHNHASWINGSALAPGCSQFDDVTKAFAHLDDLSNLTFAVSGYVDREQYARLVSSQACFGKRVPADFESPSIANATFPYWSSPALTQALELLALLKAGAIFRHASED